MMLGRGEKHRRLQRTTFDICYVYDMVLFSEAVSVPYKIMHGFEAASCVRNSKRFRLSVKSSMVLHE